MSLVLGMQVTPDRDKGILITSQGLHQVDA